MHTVVLRNSSPRLVVLAFAIPAAILLAQPARAIPDVPVDVSGWIVENYPAASGNGQWIVSGSGNEIATQVPNADPTLFLSNGQLDVSLDRAIRGTLRVDDSDDDVIGFVFGYQNRGQMYVFSWKKALQDTALRGMAILLLDTGGASSDPTRDDFFRSTNASSAQTVLASNDLPWAAATDYTYDLIFGDGEFRVIVSNGATVLEDWQISDSTFTDGDFGFYNTSQANTRYSAFVPEPSTALLLGVGLVGIASNRRRLN